MSTSHGRFSIPFFRDRIKGLKEKSSIRKTKYDIWGRKLNRLVRDMKHVIEEAKDPETLKGRNWPGGHVRVEKLIGFMLKYIEVVDIDGRIPRSYLNQAFIELDLGLDSMEINEINLFEGVDAKHSKNEDTIGV